MYFVKVFQCSALSRMAGRKVLRLFHAKVAVVWSEKDSIDEYTCVNIRTTILISPEP